MPDQAEIKALRSALRSGDPDEQHAAIDAAYQLGQGAAPLVPDLLALFTSDKYVPCTRLETQTFGHDVISHRACSVLSALKIVPDLDAVRRLLRDENVYALPEASYDQGAYIGDYGLELVAPAAVAARLADEIGPAGFDLVTQLADNAVLEDETIGKAARVALIRMSKRLDSASHRQLHMFAEAMDFIASNPDAVAPKTHRGFDMRDLAALGRQRLAKQEGDRP